MKPVSGMAITSLQVAKHRVSMLRARGNFSGAVASWLMFFDSKVAVANATVPIIPGIPLYAGAPFFIEEEIGALEFVQGCYVAISTTQANLTLSAELMDIAVELSDPENPASVSTAGDLVTAITRLAVWSEATGAASAKRLIQLEVDATLMGLAANTVAYIMGFATDAPANGNKPLFVLEIVQAQVLTGAAAISFGSEGRDVKSVDAVVLGTIPSPVRAGCTIVISTTNGVLTELVAGTVTIKAEYR